MDSDPKRNIWPPLALNWSTVFVLLCLKRTQYSAVIIPAFPLIIFLTVYILLNTTTGGPPVSEFAPAFFGTIHLLFIASDFLLLSPLHELYPIDPATKIKLPPPKTSFQYFNWAIGLLANPRAVSWSHEVPNLRRSSLSRWDFVKSQCFGCFKLYLLADAIHLYIKLNPCFDPLGPGVLGHGWGWGIWNTMMVFAFWYSWMALMHTATSVLAVALGFSEPKEWPSLFGRLRDLTGVRAFWGYVQSFSRVVALILKPSCVRTVWHQLLRRVFSIYLNLFAALTPNYSIGIILTRQIPFQSSSSQTWHPPQPLYLNPHSIFHIRNLPRHGLLQNDLQPVNHHASHPILHPPSDRHHA